MAYTILIGIIIVVAILTYIIPAGEYQMVEDEGTGRMVPVAGTYEEIESTPQGITDVIVARIKGLKTLSAWHCL